MTKCATAIAGLGMSPMARTDIGSTRDLAIAAAIACVEDAGVALRDLQGLLVCRSPSKPTSELPLRLRLDLGLGDLRLLGDLNMEGASSVGIIQAASLQIANGLADLVLCVFGDSPLGGATQSGSAAYNRVMNLTGIDGMEARSGLYGAAGPYALAAQRYLARYALAPDALGCYAVACRRWASLHPSAFLREPLDIEGYRQSRMIAEPFRVLDCAYPVNGAIAVLVCSAARARDLRQPPVYVHACGQGHAGLRPFAGDEPELETGARLAAESLWRQARVTSADVQMAQLYDAFSYVGLQALEDYQLCGRGEATSFVASGATSPGGTLPVATGGGHLSGFYLQGMTPVAEAVVQARGHAGERQSPRNELILVTGNGGRMDYHAAMLLSPKEAL
ncbi:thiolase family protein [Ramlibacter albus]|uniref:Thiolase family protein n=1 Tax=Ramlibacter albus TaxID=2079448 RepID=A0A923M427_9BURK|nr:thiolase family protein [Ramlibacter albus]MBC5763000.1 thiolase family protein [Ramlibacter albus]